MGVIEGILRYLEMVSHCFGISFFLLGATGYRVAIGVDEQR